MSRTDFGHYLPEDIMTKVDRASMAVSLEARVPLLDHKICEFAFGLASNLKIKNSEKKYILKQVAKNLLPHDFQYERKQGFSIPLKEWMQGSLGDDVEEMVNSVDFNQQINVNGVNNLIKQHRNGSHDHSKKLWSVLMLCLWQEKFS